MTFEVIGLRRHADKGVMELKFAVANASPADTTLQELGLAYANDLAGISIIDFRGPLLGRRRAAVRRRRADLP